jgi:hypothetical protein
MNYKFEVRGGSRIHVSVDRAMRKLYLLGDYQIAQSSASQGSRSAWSGTLWVDSGSHTLDEVTAALRAERVSFFQVVEKAPAPQAAEQAVPVDDDTTEEVESSLVDTSVLSQSVKKLIAALKTGEYDAFLSELIDAERAGQDRKSAVQALEARL